MDATKWLFTINILLLLTQAKPKGLDRELSCAVCRALVDEVNYSISKVDPKKTIQVGSFRVDSHGNQGTYEKPYARSEVHLIEIFESICENFKEYVETNNNIGQKSISRMKARDLDGNTLSLKGVTISAESQKMIKHKCETLIEEYEEDMIVIFRRDKLPNVEKVICVEVTSQCTPKDLQVPMPVTNYDDVPENGANKEKDMSETTAQIEKEIVDQVIPDNNQVDNKENIKADIVIEPDLKELNVSEASKDEL